MSRFVQIALFVALAGLLGGCDADTPTEPTQTPNAPVPTTATTGFAISVGLNPGTVVLGEPTVVQVTIVARRTDTNELMPRNSTAVLSTTSGLLTNGAGTASGTTVTVTFGLNGTATATLTGALEDAIVRAQIEQSFGQATLRVSPTPEIEPFSLIQAVPNFGPPSGGTEVRIEGTGFSLPAEVVFGGIAVPVLDVTSNSIRVLSPTIELPSGENRTVGITVFVNVGEELAASGTLNNAFTYTRNSSPTIPKIISVTPTTGPNEGRTRVTIFGEAFGSEIQVYFGSAGNGPGSSNVEATILDVTSNRIVVETPPATGQNSNVRNQVVDVRVRDLRSGFEATLPSAFQYGGVTLMLTSIQPADGIYLGGTLVTIFGLGGFEAPVAVSFGGEDQQVVSVSGTEIVARSVPADITCAGQSGLVSVVNIETGESGSGLSYTYNAVQPRIDSIGPTNTAVVDVETGAVIGDPLRIFSGEGFDRQSFIPEVRFFNGNANERSPRVAITSLDPEYPGYDIGDVMEVDVPAFRGLNTEPCVESGSEGTRFIDTRVTVEVTARDTGCSTTEEFTYIPNDRSCSTGPDAVFQVVENEGGDPFTIRVIDQSLGGPTSWRWDFGDGTVSLLQDPGPHTYATPGDKTIKLTVSNDSGTDTAEQTITIAAPPDPPVAIFSIEENVGGDPFTINVNDQSTGSPTSWDWSFGDGTTANGQNPGPHTYASEGTFTVTLTVSNASGSDSTTRSVTIAGPPVAAFDLFTTVLGDPFRVRVVDRSTGGTPTTWQWDFGDGTVVNGEVPGDHVYAAAGNFVIELTVTNSAGTSNASRPVVIPAP